MEDDMVENPSPQGKAIEVCRAVGRGIGSLLIYIGIILGGLVTGYRIGIYLEDATTLKDCQEVGTAKVGDRFIKCDLVPKKKDPETVPPR